MSGWWFSRSASSASRLTKAIDSPKESNSNSRSSAWPVSLQSSGVLTAASITVDGALKRSRKRRQGTELLCEFAFRPLAHLVVLPLARLRAPAPAVVAAATSVGLAGALELGRGQLVAAALLLQLKTVLDNADGQLARLTGRVTALGRYLDSESDLLVDAALFAALGWATGRYVLAAAGFVSLTLVLGVNFNAERLYRCERGDATDPMPHARGLAAVLARIYGIAYAPQDRLVEWFCERRLRRADPSTRLAYHDRLTVAVLANLGLSTQLAVFGLCLALGRPTAYAWFAVACAALLVPLALRRELLLSGRLDRTNGR
jgi:phosphatidylglycerophosphate synthase